jgi:hypothetical protein
LAQFITTIYITPTLRMMLNEAEAILERSITANEWNSLA